MVFAQPWIETARLGLVPGDQAETEEQTSSETLHNLPLGRVPIHWPIAKA